MNDFSTKLNRRKARDVLGMLDACVWLLSDTKLSRDDYDKFWTQFDELIVDVEKTAQDVQILEDDDA